MIENDPRMAVNLPVEQGEVLWHPRAETSLMRDPDLDANKIKKVIWAMRYPRAILASRGETARVFDAIGTSPDRAEMEDLAEFIIDAVSLEPDEQPRSINLLPMNNYSAKKYNQKSAPDIVGTVGNYAELVVLREQVKNTFYEYFEVDREEIEAEWHGEDDIWLDDLNALGIRVSRSNGYEQKKIAAALAGRITSSNLLPQTVTFQPVMVDIFASKPVPVR